MTDAIELPIPINVLTAAVDEIMKELRNEKEEFREYYYIERNQRIARYKTIEELKAENCKLKDQINKLKEH